MFAVQEGKGEGGLGGGIPKSKQIHQYVPPQRVWHASCTISVTGVVFERTTWVY